MDTKDTRMALLDAAQGLVQARGFNAFSYKDLAGLVGIRTASIHYHFAAKVDLALALMQRYSCELESALAVIDRPERPAKRRLERFIDLYKKTAGQGAICLCGSLSADLETLPQGLKDEVASYLRRSEDWVAGAIADGVAAGEFADDGPSTKTIAAALVAGLQGALVMARAQGPSARALAAVKSQFFASIGG